MDLIFWRRVNAMNTALKVPSSKVAQSIADIDRNSSILRLYPLPLILRVKNLQRSHWLSEQKCKGSKIGVARSIDGANSLVFFRRSLRVVHVS